MAKVGGRGVKHDFQRSGHVVNTCADLNKNLPILPFGL